MDKILAIEHWKGFECVGLQPHITQGSLGTSAIPIGCRCIAEERCRNCRIWEWKCEERQYTYYTEII